MRRSPAGPGGAGTAFRMRPQLLGRRLNVVVAVARYKPDHVITVKTTSSRFVSMTGTRLAGPAGGATRLTFLGTGHARGLLKALEPLLAAAAMRAHRGAYTEDRDRRWDTGPVPAAPGCKRAGPVLWYWPRPATRRRGARAGQGLDSTAGKYSNRPGSRRTGAHALRR